MAGFFGIVWVEEVTGMRHSALATGLLLLFILGGALVVSVLFPRRTWCRHLCPLGGVAGLCSVSSIVELRPNLDICTAKCKGHSCYKGENGVPGCPMFNHVMFTDTNQHCVLCMNCVRSCPNDSPQLNLRVPARELLTVNAASWPQTGRFVAMLAGLLVGQMLIQSWEMRPDGPLQGLAAIQRFLLLTGMLSACAGVPLALLWLASPRSGMAGDAAAEERFWRKALAWLPLVTAGLVCYQLGFAPWLPDLRVGLALAPRSGAGLRSFSVSALDLLRYGTISAGLLTTFYILWKNRKITLGEGGKGWAMAHAAAIAGLIGFWGLILALMGSPGN
jgi:ferredoxin